MKIMKIYFFFPRVMPGLTKNSTVALADNINSGYYFLSQAKIIGKEKLQLTLFKNQIMIENKSPLIF